MRVLWPVREDLSSQAGGDTVQILSTAEALRRRGVRVHLSDESRPDFRGYDLVHLFHLDRLWENERHCRRIRAQNRPAVLSPIYWSSDEYDRLGRSSVQGLLARTLGGESYRSVRIAQQWFLHCAMRPGSLGCGGPTISFHRSAEFVLRTVSVLLPNSRAEQQQIERSFRARPAVVVVPNAADPQTFRPASDPRRRHREGVLCVGRIEPRKNQLTLIRALRGTGICLTLVGEPGRHSRRYARRCAREADDRVRFIGSRPPGELSALYRSAMVHACVSWYETPGLANLEAALCGCAIVATPGGCTREYLGDEAHYCAPDDPDSIRRAVVAAMSEGPPPSLSDRVAREFTWEAAADKTLRAYHRALARGV
jgi:glycosyltransferase involved in cell wall biosynthesis